MTATTTDKADKTEKDHQLTISDLVTKVGTGVLKNPFLTAIIEADPSPKAADVHMRRLGWPNDLARKIRQGVYLFNKCRQHGEELWADMTKVTIRLSEQMLRFGFRLEGFEIKEKWETSWEDRFQLDGVHVVRNEPLFLREIRMISRPEWHITSVDYDGLKEWSDNGFSKKDDLFEWDPLTDFGYSNSVNLRGLFQGKSIRLQFPKTSFGGSAFYEVGEHPWGIKLCTKTFILNANPARGRGFPHLYKVVELKNAIRAEETADETVRILLRRDYGPELQPGWFGEEWVTLERVVHISSKIDAVLIVWFQVFPNSDHLFRYENKEGFVRLRFRTRNEEGSSEGTGDIALGHFDQQRITPAVQKLSKLAGRIFSCSPVAIKLERIAGFSLVTAPPKELVL